MTNSQRYHIVLCILLFTSCLLLSHQEAAAQVKIQRPPEKTRLLFLLDASGSMFAPWENSIRMDIAKRILTEMVDSLRVDKDLQLALRVYGHQFHRKYQNCKDTKLEVPFRANNHDDIIYRLRQIQPQGVTPIANSLEQAANDFTINPEYRNVVILLTDGIESCGGDPCAVSKALQERGVFLKPLVIGMGMDEDYTKEFSCLGQFFDPKTVHEFREVLNEVLHQSLDETSVSVELLDVNGQPRETNVNVTFVNNITQAPVYDFVHYRDAQGRPDSVILDPVISYDVVVNTIPPVLKRDVNFEGGKHNVVRIQSPQGTLALRQKNHTDYAKGVKALIRPRGKAGVVNVHDMGTDEKYLVGTYDLEVLTLPKTYFREVSIKQSETTTLEVPAPGILHIDLITQGYGSIYKVYPDGRQEWVIDLEQDKTRLMLALQPGDYKVAFRAKDSFGSKYTEVKPFNISSGRTVNIKLFGK